MKKLTESQLALLEEVKNNLLKLNPEVKTENEFTHFDPSALVVERNRINTFMKETEIHNNAMKKAINESLYTTVDEINADFRNANVPLICELVQGTAIYFAPKNAEMASVCYEVPIRIETLFERQTEGSSRITGFNFYTYAHKLNNSPLKTKNISEILTNPSLQRNLIALLKLK